MADQPEQRALTIVGVVCHACEMQCGDDQAAAREQWIRTTAELSGEVDEESWSDAEEAFDAAARIAVAHYRSKVPDELAALRARVAELEAALADARNAEETATWLCASTLVEACADERARTERDIAAFLRGPVVNDDMWPCGSDTEYAADNVDASDYPKLPDGGTNG